MRQPIKDGIRDALIMFPLAYLVACAAMALITSEPFSLNLLSHLDTDSQPTYIQRTK